MKKDFLSITDLSKEEIIYLIELAITLKEELINNGTNMSYLKNKTLTMIFEKPSLRTQVSFETDDPKKAADNADVIYTDTWISMGDEEEKQKRLKIFLPYQVTSKLMNLAKKDAIFMHDMPAYRDHEVSPEVIDGKQSIIFHQAENRLHAQKALLIFLLNNSKKC